MAASRVVPHAAYSEPDRRPALTFRTSRPPRATYASRAVTEAAGLRATSRSAHVAREAVASAPATTAPAPGQWRHPSSGTMTSTRTRCPGSLACSSFVVAARNVRTVAWSVPSPYPSSSAILTPATPGRSASRTTVASTAAYFAGPACQALTRSASTHTRPCCAATASASATYWGRTVALGVDDPEAPEDAAGSVVQPAPTSRTARSRPPTSARPVDRRGPVMSDLGCGATRRREGDRSRRRRRRSPMPPRGSCAVG